MSITRKPYTTNVSDEAWAFVVPYLTLLSEDASQRRYDLREVYNGLRYIVKRVPTGGTCPKICRRDRLSTSKRAAGSSSAILPGSPASVAWPRGCLAITSSLSPV